MRIIYGVSGEGSGHSSRAKEMLAHLTAAGHEPLVVSYHRGYETLHKRFPCRRIEGLRIVSVDNKVSVPRTLWYNLRRLPRYLRSMDSLQRVFDDFRPDLVITDFEPMCARLAHRRGLPLISLDNQHRMRFMDYESPAHLRWSRWMTETVIRLVVPHPDVVLATTFMQGPVRNDHTFLFPPILRSELSALQPAEGDYHLVYLTSAYDSLLAALREMRTERFLVYGYNRNEVCGNLRFCEFSTQGFLRDLAGCRSVMATAGYTLMSEAMFLQKPYLAFPMHGQFEQQLNAFCLETLGYGMNAGRADEDTLRRFLCLLPRYREALGHYADGYSNNPDAPRNEQICARLDALLADNAALLRKFQQSSRSGPEARASHIR